MTQTQYVYGSCWFSPTDDQYVIDFWLFTALIFFWKLCQSIWGIHHGLNVTRISWYDTRTDIFKLFLQFDETSTILFSIGFTYVIIIIAIPILLIGILTHSILITYFIQTIGVLVVGNVVVGVNLFPRIIAVFKGKDGEDIENMFVKSPAERMLEKLEKEFMKLASHNKWTIVDRGDTLRSYQSQQVETMHVSEMSGSLRNRKLRNERSHASNHSDDPIESNLDFERVVRAHSRLPMLYKLGSQTRTRTETKEFEVAGMIELHHEAKAKYGDIGSRIK